MSRSFWIASIAVLGLIGCNPGRTGGPIVAVEGPIAHEVAVSVPFSEIDARLGSEGHIRVFDGTDTAHPLPHQLDDLDGDGSPDVVFTLVGPTDQSIRLLIEESATAPEFVKRAQAVLAVRQGGRFENGLYVGGGDYVHVDGIDVPPQQVQDSDWAMYEGPVWESDLIGWRYYLDARNRTDIFGKKTSDLVLGEFHADYHTVSDWGADILKVGMSLGIGSPAIETDGGPQVIDNTSSKRVDIVANGPLRAIIRTTYLGWQVGERALNVVSELENRAGQRWTEQRLKMSGDSSGVHILTGIVKHAPAPDLTHGTEAGIFFAYTYGDQTEQGDALGMAVLVPPDYEPELGGPDPLTHLIRLTPVGGQVAYRYMASWEMEPDAATDAMAFETMVRSAAAAWAEERILNVSSY